MKEENPLPSEPKLLMFSWAASVCRKLLPDSLRRVSGVILFGVTPEIPISLTSTLSQKTLRRAFIHGAVNTFLFCFVVTAIWTWFIGTFRGSEPGRVYFLDDKWNMINYTIICPLYVGLSATLVVLACQAWVRLTLNPDLSAGDGRRNPKLPIGVTVLIIISIAAALTCNYISECLNPAVYTKVFWYISRVDSEGQRIMGGLGVYYALLNYSLLIVVLLAAAALIPLMAVAAEVGRYLRATATSAPASFDALRENLSDFVSAYIVAKILTAVLMLNAFTWKWSAPQRSVNLVVAGIVLSLISLIFISFPRYYIELEWYALSVRRAQASGEPIPTEAADLRSQKVRLFAHLLDTLLLGGFFTAFWFN
jgi:hypothetical protein